MGGWQRVDVELVSGLKGPLRLDLTDCPAVIEVAGLTIRSLVNDDILWAASGSDICSYSLGGTIVPLGLSESGNACRFFSFGTDPQLILPDLNSDNFDQPLRLQIWLRVRPEFSALIPLLNTRSEVPAEVGNGTEVEAPGEAAGLKEELARVTAERDALLAGQKQREVDTPRMARDYDQIKQEKESLAAKHDELLAEHSKARTQIFLFKTEAKQARKELENTRSELMQVRVSYDACRTQRAELENAALSLRSDLAGRDDTIRRLEAAVQELATCRSMRVTAPMRAFGRLFKGG